MPTIPNDTKEHEQSASLRIKKGEASRHLKPDEKALLDLLARIFVKNIVQ